MTGRSTKRRGGAQHPLPFAHLCTHSWAYLWTLCLVKRFDPRHTAAGHMQRLALGGMRSAVQTYQGERTVMTQPMMHTMRMVGQEKPWRPANFPPHPPITSAPIDGAEPSSWTTRKPRMGEELIQRPASARPAARVTFAARVRRFLSRHLPGRGRRNAR
jgi:hypothetical protein